MCKTFRHPLSGTPVTGAFSCVLKAGLAVSIFFFAAPSSAAAAPGLQCHEIFAATEMRSAAMAEPRPPANTEPTPAVLFQNGTFRPDYQPRMRSLKAGDQILMPSGRVHTIFGVIGEGQLNRVFDLGDGWLLRVPAGDGRDLKKGEGHASRDEYLRSLQDFKKVHDELKKSGVRVVEIDEARSEVPFALVVKKQQFLFTGDQFAAALRAAPGGAGAVAGPAGRAARRNAPGIDAETLTLARRALLDFMDRTWMFDDIGDFHIWQMGFTGREWILFDMGDGVDAKQKSLTSFASKSHALRGRRVALDANSNDVGTVSDVPADLELEITQRISAIRLAKMRLGSWYQREGRDFYRLIKKITSHPIAPSTVLEIIPTAWAPTREALGFLPDARRLELKIEDFDGEKKDTARYTARLVNPETGEIFRGELRIAIPADAEKKIAKAALKALKKEKAFFAGQDFIFFYGDGDTSRLRSVKNAR